MSIITTYRIINEKATSFSTSSFLLHNIMDTLKIFNNTYSPKCSFHDVAFLTACFIWLSQIVRIAL